MSLSRRIGRAKGAPLITVQSGNIILDNNVIAEYSAVDTFIGNLSVDLPGKWYFSLITGYDAGGSAKLAGLRKAKVTCSASPFVASANTAPVIRVRAESYAPPRVIEQTIQLNVTPIDLTGVPPSIDLDLINKVYTGATLANLGLVAGDLEVNGYENYGPNTNDYMLPNSKNPGGAGWSGTKLRTEAMTEEGFTPVIVSDGGFDNGTGYRCVSPYASIVGETYYVTFRFGQTTLALNKRIQYRIGGCVNKRYTDGGVTDLTSASYRVPGYNSPDLVKVVKHPDGSYECTYRVVALNANPINVEYQFGNTGGGEMRVYGCSIHRGPARTGFKATGAGGGAVPIKGLTLAGPLAVVMTGAAWTLAVEVQMAEKYYPMNVLTDQTAPNNRVLALGGYTHALVGRGEDLEVPVGMGGFCGIARIVLTGDATGIKCSINNGKVIAASAVAFSGAIELLKNAYCLLRRVSAWNVKLSDADLMKASSITNRQMTQLGDCLWPGFTSNVFLDHFDDGADAVRKRPGDGQSFTPWDFNHHVGYYYQTTQPGRWIPRYVQWQSPMGSHGPQGATGQASESQNINGEFQLYVDPQFCGDGTLTGGYPGPILYNRKASCITIKTDKLADLPQAFQDKIPNRQAYYGGPYDATKWPYVSGVLIAAGAARIGVNSLWSYRAKAPAGQALWPAFWGLRDSVIDGDLNGGYGYNAETELDIFEGIGQTPGVNRSAIHANNYAINKDAKAGNGEFPALGFNYNDDFHNFEAVWLRGIVHYGVSGRYLASISTTGSNFDTYKQYPLLNTGVGGSYPGNPTAATDAVMPCYHDIDYVRLDTVSANPIVLANLTLSALTGTTAIYSGTLSGLPSGVTLKLLDDADGIFTLSGTTLSLVPAKAFAATHRICVALIAPGAIGDPLVQYFDITLRQSAPPSAPGNLALSKALAGALAVTWDAPLTGDAITAYALEYALAGSNNWLVAYRPAGVGRRGVVTGLLADTDYDVRVRGVAQTGPGALSAVLTVRTAAAAPILRDAFTPETANVKLPLHTADSGQVWARSASFGPSTADSTLSSAGFVVSGGADWLERSYTSAADMGDADYAVHAVLSRNAASVGNIVGLLLRAQASGAAYLVVWNDYSQKWELRRHPASVGWDDSTIVVVADFADTFTPGESRVLSGSIVGNQIVVAVDGVNRISVTDATITAKGSAGLIMRSANTGHTAVTVDYLEAA